MYAAERWPHIDRVLSQQLDYLDVLCLSLIALRLSVERLPGY